MFKWYRAFTHPVWTYRFRYDNNCCAWIVELNITGLDTGWVALHSIVENRLVASTFETYDDAKAHVDRIGLGKAYRLDSSQEDMVEAYEDSVLPSNSEPNVRTLPHKATDAFAR